VLRRLFLSRVTHLLLLLVFSHYALGKEPLVSKNQPSPQTKTARQLVGPRTCDTFYSCLIYLSFASPISSSNPHSSLV